VTNFHKDLLLEILIEWDNEKLSNYISLQEERLKHTHSLLRDLREIQRKRNKKKPLDTGARDGR
jgi:hypothetical protein